MAGADTLDDPILDAAYAASFDAGDKQTAIYYAAEINARLMSVWSFLGGAVGVERFPLYAARSTFSQVDAAQSSVADSASVVAGDIKSALKIGIGGVAVFALVAVAVYAFFGRK